VFSELGAKLTVLHNSPNGTNINDNCGSQHIEELQQVVRETGASIGCAFDGDGDRLIAVDETGEAVTGDQILAVCAKHMKQSGLLKNNIVVSTVMSNLGLRLALKSMGIKHLITDVGDRHVLDMMQKSDAVIGGEDSGHMIFLDNHTSGDGILTALKLIAAMIESGRPLSELSRIMDRYPQILKNVRIKEKTDIYQFPKIAGIIKKVEDHLGDQGRVLVRYSGTQPLCRIMVEGPDPDDTRQLCKDIVDVIAAELGGSVQ
jgi:phosphoglucosamine mutase